MDDTTHPCFYSRCMVWWCTHPWIQTKLRRKSCQIPKQVKAGLWDDGMTGWSMGWSLWMEMAWGGCIEWSHNNKWLIPDVTKHVPWRNNFDVIWKDWGLEERTTSQSFCCVSISVLCVLFVYPPLFFCPSDKKSQQKSVRHAAVHRFESGSHFYGYWPSHVTSCFSAGYETESLSLHLHEIPRRF